MATSRDLREWQKVALNLWQKKNFRGIVEVATAGGKTIFAIEGAKIWLKENPDGKILVIVPTTALQDQWYVTLLDEMKIDKSEICLWPERENVNALIHVMVVNTARTKSLKVANASPKLLLIADECHRYASPENANALSVSATASLGLTATAERDYDDGLNEVLIPNLGPVIYKYTIADARADGVVAPFNVFNVRIQFTPLEEIEYGKITQRMAQAYSKGDEDKAVILARLRASVSRNAARRIPAAIAIAEENRGRRIIIFHEEIEKAEVLKSLLSERGNSVGIYHSQLGSDKRRDNLLQFRRGMLEILVCCRALDEGVDVPEADVAIIAASTASSRQRIQRIGRVIRVHRNKESARIYTLYVTEREEEYLRGEEQRLSSILNFKWFEMGSK
jgi:superfamily II DNA or RNA helicase